MNSGARPTKNRAGKEKPKLLSELTGNTKYKADERAYEDEFASRGGEAYSGKIIGDESNPTATELLTTGIQRLHENPGLFQAQDPEYFDFVIQTLQNP